jgi:hypothetical protein
MSWWWPSSTGWRGRYPMLATSSPSSPPATSRSASGGRCTTRPTPSAGCCFNVLAMVAEFESDLIKMRTREGMKVARTKGRLRGKKPKLSPRQETHLGALHHAGTHTSAELAELFSSPAPPSTGRSSAHAQQPHPSPDVLPCTSGQLGSSGAG